MCRPWPDACSLERGDIDPTSSPCRRNRPLGLGEGNEDNANSACVRGWRIDTPGARLRLLNFLFVGQERSGSMPGFRRESQQGALGYIVEIDPAVKEKKARECLCAHIIYNVYTYIWEFCVAPGARFSLPFFFLGTLIREGAWCASQTVRKELYLVGYSPVLVVYGARLSVHAQARVSETVRLVPNALSRPRTQALLGCTNRADLIYLILQIFRSR